MAPPPRFSCLSVVVIWSRPFGDVDESPDVFGDGGGDGVSEGSDAGRLQSVGKPISHSTACALGLHESVSAIAPRMRASVAAFQRPPWPSPHPRSPIEAVGVGHQEQPSSHVWGTHGARGYD